MSTNVTRRSFLKVTALAGGGFMLALHGIEGALASTVTEEVIFEPNALIKIASNGTITLMAPNPEIGQGVKTSLPMLLAEELDVNWESVVIEQAPLDSKKFSRQSAGGSGSVRSSWESFRKIGATARHMLVQAAAQTWKVEAAECYTEKGFVIHKSSDKKLGYGALAVTAATLAPPSDVAVKDPKDFKLIGKRVRNVDNKKIATGKQAYGIDTKREGMLYAMVVRPPAFGKKLKSFDDQAARAVPGVKNIVSIENKIAVLATSTWEAKKGRDALIVEWEDEKILESTADHQQSLKDLIAGKHETPKRTDGDAEKALSEGAKILEHTFEAPFLPHAPMEPMNFFADVRGDKVELYGPIQVPARGRGDVAKALGIPEDNITVGMSRIGGGFGRRLQTDYAVEAALISQKAKVPVQVIWTREDDMQGGFYRPTGMYRYRAAIDSTNELSAWYLIAAAVNQDNATRHDNFPAGAIPNFRVDSHNLKSAISTGPWRAPNHNFLAFAEESFIDEIANELKKDPVAFRIELLDRAKNNQFGKVTYDVERYKAVIRLAAEMGKWGTASEPGIYKGFGSHFSFGTYAAQVAEVSIQNGRVKVHKICCAIDCGRIVNLSGAETQVEGGIIDGLGHALYGELLFDNGATVQKNFNTYKLIRMPDVPRVEVKFIDSNENPMGLGEPGLPPVAAAVSNAIFRATGQRIKKLPFSLTALTSS
jgi:isoquinoline 1-oxidoreductase subunit beta